MELTHTILIKFSAQIHYNFEIHLLNQSKGNGDSFKCYRRQLNSSIF